MTGPEGFEQPTTRQVSASIQPQSDQNRPGVAESTPDPQSGSEAAWTDEHCRHGEWCFGSGPECGRADERAREDA